MKVLRILVIVTSMFTLASCASNQSASQRVEEGKLVRLTTEEIVQAVTGNSEVWPGRGSGYYNPNGQYEGIWDGHRAEGPWWVENDVRCYDVEPWGGEWCHELYQEGNQIRFVRQGSDKVLNTILKEGKQF